MLLVLLLAAVPTALYSCLLWRLDRYEKEPWNLLLAAFGWGALPALLLAGLVETGLSTAFAEVIGPDRQAQVVGPLVEEPLKALALIGLFRWARREFNGVVDGIVYGALIGFGFAMSENVLYFWSNPDQLLSVWLLRSVLFGFNHALFTSVVGIALGLVRFQRQRRLGYAALPAALCVAILLHSLHNTVVTQGLLGVGYAWIVDSGGVIVVLLVVVLAQQEEHRWLLTHLPGECDGKVLASADLRRVLHPAARVRAEIHVLIHYGWSAYRKLRQFHHLLCELAFLKHQFAQGDRDCCDADVARLRSRIATQRASIVNWS